MDNATKLNSLYMDWVKKDFEYSNLTKDYVSISTPFIDNNYDNINLYASFIDENTIIVSDFGYTLYNLEEQGIELRPKFKTAWKIFNDIISTFGVNYDNSSLTIKVPLDKFPIAKSRLLQAIMRINDISYLNKNNIIESFNEIVSAFFRKSNVLYTPSFEIPNSFGTSSYFDFSIPNKNDKERLVKTISRPGDINQAKIFNFDVKATKPVRDSKYILLVNDSNKKSLTSSLVSTALHEIDKPTASVLGFEEVKKENKELLNA